MTLLFATLSGVIFGLGLIMGGMSSPAKVLAFLDLGGAWDPSLALVMAGAIAVGLPTFYFAKRRQQSLLGLPVQLPTTSAIDTRLLLGSAAFGAGWGLAGICPGPALVLISMGSGKGWLFFAAMLAGMAVFEVAQRLNPKSDTKAIEAS